MFAYGIEWRHCSDHPVNIRKIELESRFGITIRDEDWRILETINHGSPNRNIFEIEGFDTVVVSRFVLLSSEEPSNIFTASTFGSEQYGGVLIVFAFDEGGNSFALDYSSPHDYKVVYIANDRVRWDSTDLLSRRKEGLKVVANSIMDFIEHLKDE